MFIAWRAGPKQGGKSAIISRQCMHHNPWGPNIDKRLHHNLVCLRESLEPRLPGFLCWLLGLSTQSVAFNVLFNKYTLDISYLACTGLGRIEEEENHCLSLSQAVLVGGIGSKRLSHGLVRLNKITSAFSPDTKQKCGDVSFHCPRDTP